MAKNVSIDELIFDPNNARSHNNKNRFAIRKSLENFGPARSIVVDKDNVVRAGNGTLEAAIASGVKKVRVIEADGDELIAVQRKDWDATQALAYAVADNRSGELAEWNSEVLAASLNQLKNSDFDLNALGFDNEEVKKALKPLKVETPSMDDIYSGLREGFENGLDPEMQQKSSSVSNATTQKRMVYESENELGIPELWDEMLYDGPVPEDIYVGVALEDYSKSIFIYGKHALPKDADGGVVSFYTDDHKFETAWSSPIPFIEKIMASGIETVMAPDFSMWQYTMPVVEQLWNLYRSQWLARCWQNEGVKVIPSLKWGPPETQDLCFDLVPKDASLVSIQLRTLGRDKTVRKLFVHEFTNLLKRRTPERVIMYGGTTHRNWLEPELVDMECEFFWLEDWNTVYFDRKNRDFGKEKYNA